MGYSQGFRRLKIKDSLMEVLSLPSLSSRTLPLLLPLTLTLTLALGLNLTLNSTLTLKLFSLPRLSSAMCDNNVQ